MCGCGKSNGNTRRPTVPQKGLSLDLRKSRQLPAPALRQLSAQAQTNNNAKQAQENLKKIRQRSIREKFGHA